MANKRRGGALVKQFEFRMTVEEWLKLQQMCANDFPAAKQRTSAQHRRLIHEGFEHRRSSRTP